MLYRLTARENGPEFPSDSIGVMIEAESVSEVMALAAKNLPSQARTIRLERVWDLPVIR